MSSSQSESEEDRAHRLHLRLRFTGAVAVDMTPLEFASKLLRLWNAKLVLVKKKESPKSKGTRKEEIRDEIDFLAIPPPVSDAVDKTEHSSLALRVFDR